MKNLLKSLLVLGLLGAAACSMTPRMGRMDAAQTLYAAEGSYAAALRLAVAYRNLPRCAVGGTTLCHSPAVVLVLRANNDRAIAALRAAEGVISAHGAAAQIAAAVSLASAAVADFSAAVPVR